MLVFIDESGDAGFKLPRGSSSHFVIACVIFDDNLDAEETSLKIKRYRRTLGRRDDHEFKFNKSNKDVRMGFFDAVADCRFRVRAVVVDKSQVTSDHLRRDKASFHNYFIGCVLAQSDGTISDARVRIDGRGDRDYKRSANAYFRRRLNSKDDNVVRNVKFVDSTNDSLIQLADMVAGAINRNESGEKSDATEYIRALRKNIQDIWRFK